MGKVDFTSFYGQITEAEAESWVCGHTFPFLSDGLADTTTPNLQTGEKSETAISSQSLAHAVRLHLWTTTRRSTYEMTFFCLQKNPYIRYLGMISTGGALWPGKAKVDDESRRKHVRMWKEAECNIASALLFLLHR